MKINKYKSEWMKKWRKNNPTKARIQSKKWNELYKKRHPEKAKEIAKIALKKWRIKNPKKIRAHRKVYCALRNGTLRKKPCEVCGINKVSAHHNDYNKPLKVKWLCKIHHTLDDKMKRKLSTFPQRYAQFA